MFTIVLVCASGAQATAIILPFNSPLNLAVLGVASATITNSNVTITGNEGIFSSGTISNMAPSTVTGNVYEASSGEESGPGHVGGSVIVDFSDLQTAVNDATSAATTAAGYTATQTFGTISSATTITGNGGLNVIDINGNITNSITLKGGASDIFVVNVTGSLTLTGATGLLLSGINADQVLYNFDGSSGNISAQVGNTLDGTLLAPKYTITNGDGNYTGEIIASGNISLLSGATVTADDFIGVSSPEPGTMVLIGSGLIALALFARKRLPPSPPAKS